jgi:hypothetical protein
VREPYALSATARGLVTNSPANRDIRPVLLLTLLAYVVCVSNVAFTRACPLDASRPESDDRTPRQPAGSSTGRKAQALRTDTDASDAPCRR